MASLASRGSSCTRPAPLRARPWSVQAPPPPGSLQNAANLARDPRTPSAVTAAQAPRRSHRSSAWSHERSRSRIPRSARHRANFATKQATRNARQASRCTPASGTLESVPDRRWPLAAGLLVAASSAGQRRAESPGYVGNVRDSQPSPCDRLVAFAIARRAPAKPRKLSSGSLARRDRFPAKGSRRPVPADDRSPSSIAIVRMRRPWLPDDATTAEPSMMLGARKVAWSTVPRKCSGALIATVDRKSSPKSQSERRPARQ